MKNIQTFFSSYIPSSMAMSISVVVFFITFMVLSPIVALVFLLATILSVVSAIIMGKKAKKIQLKQSSNISKLSNYFFTILQGIHIVKYYGSQKNLHAIGASLGEEYRKTTMSLLKVVFISAGIIAMLGGAVIGVAFNAISYNQNSDYFNYGLAIFMLLMAGESFALLRSLLESFHAKSKAVTSIERIGATFGDKVFSLEDNIIASKEEDLSFLEFNNVSFSYNNKNEVINNLNWKINAGEYWVVRGESGCGKSTIIDMLLGFISPTKGEITINGNQLKKDERNQILQISSLVEQQANLFYGSIKENLLLANQSATMEKIEEVCKNLHLHEWIESLPNKYEEVISSNSRNISGGQAHRMSLARALLAKPQILVLDEYSAHLDHKTYTDIQKYIYDLHKKESISIIEISHNLNEEINYENIKILDISQDGFKVV
jgi:ABC-type transport system involved in cytochrome bd biosynthesis fused ATPase/permease subunit